MARGRGRCSGTAMEQGGDGWTVVAAKRPSQSQTRRR
eukprot:SAG22_NODE_21603_length_255_cov_1.628205_1_plen_36_part_10